MQPVTILFYAPSGWRQEDKLKASQYLVKHHRLRTRELEPKQLQFVVALGSKMLHRCVVTNSARSVKHMIKTCNHSTVDRSSRKAHRACINDGGKMNYMAQSWIYFVDRICYNYSVYADLHVSGRVPHAQSSEGPVCTEGINV